MKACPAGCETAGQAFFAVAVFSIGTRLRFHPSKPPFHSHENRRPMQETAKKKHLYNRIAKRDSYLCPTIQEKTTDESTRLQSHPGRSRHPPYLHTASHLRSHRRNQRYVQLGKPGRTAAKRRQVGHLPHTDAFPRTPPYPQRGRWQRLAEILPVPQPRPLQGKGRTLPLLLRMLRQNLLSEQGYDSSRRHPRRVHRPKNELYHKGNVRGMLQTPHSTLPR